ncbi:MAG: PD40 domain-containing protein, partial [Crocinitomicaceae bacterium]|nr:PD40 domain-containing protein [Crocinitomicaceae bacterium]
MYRIILFICVFFISGINLAQSKRMRLADELFAVKSYYAAVQAYEDALERSKDSFAVANNISFAYDIMGNVPKAIAWYGFLGQNDSLGEIQMLRYAILLRQNGETEKSEQWLLNTLALNNQNATAKNLLSNQRYKGGMTEYFSAPENSHLTKESDISINLINNKEAIVTSSKRNAAAIMRTAGQPKVYFYDMYRLEVSEDGGFGAMQRIRGEGNTKFHDGPAVFDPNSGYLYFTRNNIVEGKRRKDEQGITKLKIFRGKLEGNKIVDVEELPFNSDTYSCGHPAISPDGKTLYFASDMPGSFGGTDIYKVEIKEDGSFGKPINLGAPVNTVLNEVTPFVHPESGLLFFASNGHYGHGGLDVFVAYQDENQNFVDVSNLGESINTSFDDFAFVSNKEQSFGFLASNRGEDWMKPDDLFYFSQLKPLFGYPIIEGSIKDYLSEEPLSGAVILIKNERGEIIDSIPSDESGRYRSHIKKGDDKVYMSISQAGFDEKLIELELPEKRKIYEVNASLNPILNYYLEGLVLDEKSGERLDGVKVEVIKMDEQTGDEAVVYATNISGIFNFEPIQARLNGYLAYELRLSKDGYRDKRVELLIELSRDTIIFAHEFANLNLSKRTRDDQLADEINESKEMSVRILPNP